MVREMVEKREGIGSEAAAAAAQARWSIGPSLGKEMGATRAEVVDGTRNFMGGAVETDGLPRRAKADWKIQLHRCDRRPRHLA